MPEIRSMINTSFKYNFHVYDMKYIINTPYRDYYYYLLGLKKVVANKWLKWTTEDVGH